MKLHKTKVIVLLFFFVLVLSVFLYNVSFSDVNAETNNEVVFEFKNSVETIKMSQKMNFYYKLKKKNLPDDAEIEWYVNDEQIISIEGNGVLEALKRGEVQLKASLKGTNYSTTCTVKVVPNNLAFYLRDSSEKISSYRCEKGTTFAIRVNDKYNSVQSNELEYSSSNEEVATIDQNGNITTKIAGKATIIATLVGDEKITKRLNLEVTTAVSDLKIYDDSYEIYVGDNNQIDFEVFPSNATNKNIKYEVEDKQVVSVSSNGKITGKKAGDTTITMTSKSNPEIQKRVSVNVSGHRDYKLVESSQISQTEEYILRYLKSGQKIKINGDYSQNAVVKCSNDSLIDYEIKDNYITITGVERGVAILEVTDGEVIDKIKVLVNKYKDDETETNSVPVSKIILPTRESDLVDGLNYINDTKIAVGETWSFKYYISPVDASLDDLQYSISNEKDFTLSNNGKITAINPNKSTKLTVSSKSNPSVIQTINLSSEIGNVERVEFAKAYVGENSLDINKSKSFPFYPIFYMENGKIYDPTRENLDNDETYNSLLRKVKITTNDTDVIKISSNKVFPIEGVTGSGRLELIYNEGKENEKRATTTFESNGIIVEKIKSIRFVRKVYDMDEGGNYGFNPIIVTNTNKTYNPEIMEVRESQEYKNLLANVQLEVVGASNGYLSTDSLVNIISNNVVTLVYDGKCKLKMSVVGTDISDVTVLDISFNNKEIEKNIDDIRYVGANCVTLVSDKNNSSSTGVKDVFKGTELYVFEKFKDGWTRVKYEGNDQLYIHSSNLTLDPPKVESDYGNIEKTINGYRYIGYDNVQLSKKSGETSSIPVATKIYVFEKFTTGWVRLKYNGDSQWYVEAEHLTELPPLNANKNEKTGRVTASSLNVRSSANSTINSNIIGSLPNGATVSIIKKEGKWYLISYNGSQAYVSADYVKEDTSSTSNTTAASSASSSSSSNTNSDKVQEILNEAKKHLGVPYVSGGTTPAGFDCSGYVQYVMKQCGISVNRTTETQWPNDGVFVKKSELKPGDLVYFGPSNAPNHVGIYVGDNTMIHSPRPGKSIMYLNIDYMPECIGGKRLI